MKIISKTRNITLTVVNEASLVSMELGHWYGNGAMHAKHIVALGMGLIFQCSDYELSDELSDKKLLKVLWYKSESDKSTSLRSERKLERKKLERLQN